MESQLPKTAKEEQDVKSIRVEPVDGDVKDAKSSEYAVKPEADDADALVEPLFVPIKLEPDFEGTFEESVMEENFEATENIEGMDSLGGTIKGEVDVGEALIEPLFVPIKSEPDFETTSEEAIDENLEEGVITEEFSQQKRHTAWNRNLQFASLSIQSPSDEVRAVNSQKLSTSSCKNVVLSNLLSRKPFTVASCSTPDAALSREEVAHTNLSMGQTEQEAAGNSLGQLSDEGEAMSCASQEETAFQRETQQCGSSGNSTDERPFQCIHCGKTFTRKRTLDTHMRIHTGEKPYRCSQCGKSFIEGSSLTKHMRKHNDRSFKCSLCGKCFIHNSSLTEHIRRHSGERPYKCSQCGRSFTQSYSLTTHMRTHTGDRPYTCSLCGKSFSHGTTLAKHIQIHSEDRPYKCSECDASYRDRSNLIKHRRTHTGERPYKCTECGKSFIRSCHLTVHMNVHTGDKPFQCFQCGKSFTRSSNLNVHVRTHTE